MAHSTLFVSLVEGACSLVCSNQVFVSSDGMMFGISKSSNA
jgi:hypothetical protein